MKISKKKQDSSLLNKAIEVFTAVKDKSTEFVSDEKLADLIVQAASKQEGVNQILKTRNSNYRVGDIGIELSIPPSIIFGIRRISDHETAAGLLTTDSEESSDNKPAIKET